MTDTPLQVAKREVQELLQARPIWIGLLAAGVILGVMGPFGTDAVMPLLPRLVYWTCLASASFVLGSVESEPLTSLLDRRSRDPVLAALRSRGSGHLVALLSGRDRA